MNISMRTYQLGHAGFNLKHYIDNIDVLAMIKTKKENVVKNIHENHL